MGGIVVHLDAEGTDIYESENITTNEDSISQRHSFSIAILHETDDNFHSQEFPDGTRSDFLQNLRDGKYDQVVALYRSNSSNKVARHAPTEYCQIKGRRQPV